MEAQVVEELLARYPNLRMTYEEFLTSGSDVHGDWVDGQVRLIGPDTTLHNRTTVFLSTILAMMEEERSGGRILTRFQMRPRPDLPSREVDLLFLRDENRGRVRDYFVDGPADLVIEVVMEESRTLDTVENVREYAAGGVPEYWVFDPERREVTAYRLGANGYETIQPDAEGRLHSEAMDGMWIDPAWFRGERLPNVWWVLETQWGLI